MISIGTTVTPAILPSPKLVPELFSGRALSTLGADQKAAALAHTAAEKAAAQLAADTKAQAGSNTIRSDQQAVAAKEAAAARADTVVQQNSRVSPGLNVTV